MKKENKKTSTERRNKKVNYEEEKRQCDVEITTSTLLYDTHEKSFLRPSQAKIML